MKRENKAIMHLLGKMFAQPLYHVFYFCNKKFFSSLQSQKVTRVQIWITFFHSGLLSSIPRRPEGVLGLMRAAMTGPQVWRLLLGHGTPYLCLELSSFCQLYAYIFSWAPVMQYEELPLGAGDPLLHMHPGKTHAGRHMLESKNTFIILQTFT